MQVHNDDTVPNYVLESYIESTTNNTSFADEILKRSTAPVYGNFKTRYENAITGYVGLRTSFRAEFSEFIEGNLPWSLISHTTYGNPYDKRLRTSWHGPDILGVCRLGNWVHHKLYQDYDYCVQDNNLLAISYQKQDWVNITAIKVHLPGVEADYDSRTLSLTDVAQAARKQETGDEYNSHQLIEFVFHPLPDSETGAVTVEGSILPHVVVDYRWGSASNTLQFTIPEDVLDTTKEFWQINFRAYLYYGSSRRYKLIGPSTSAYTNTNIYGTWIYEKGSGDYAMWDSYIGNPLVDNERPGSNIYEEFLPTLNAAIYYDSNSGGMKNVLDAPGGAEGDIYKSWANYAKAFGLNPLETAERIKETVDLTNVHRSVFEFAVPINTQDPLLLKYLFKLFNRWSDVFVNKSITLISNEEDHVNITYTGYLSRNYKFSLITKEIVSGKYAIDAAVNSYSSVSGSRTETFKNFQGTQESTQEWEGIKFYHQHSETEYTVIRVGSPVCIYSSARRKKFGTEPTDDRFLMPMSMEVAKEFGGLEFEELMRKSFRFTHLLAETYEISFMETEFFQETMEWFQETSQITFAIVGIYNIAVGFGLNALMSTLVYAVIKVGVDALMEVIVEELGEDVAVALAVVALAAGVSSGLNGSSFFNGLIDGGLLINVANGLVTAANEHRLEGVKTAYKELHYEYQEFEKEYEKDLDALEEAKETLGRQYQIDPFLFIGRRPLIIPGETPQAYYERTIHSGNIGTKAFDMVHDHVANNLRLPSFKDSVGDTLYA